MAANIDRILDQLADLLAQDKKLHLENTQWKRHARTGFDQLEFVAPVSVGGVIRDGLQARVSCRSDLPEEDVHAQLQVYVPSIAGYAHIQRVDWRPPSPHTNNSSAPSRLRFKTYKTRWYEFGLNRRLGVAGLRQTTTMIARPLPREVESFYELMVLLEDIWKISGMSRVPIPPWE